ncbi:hypothetical protein N7510_007548 [Penicillium lagena]|uniref:uncharacterized protein n=1 Tax=Penicillium lagena TaxID=94218 RepID=UPI0025410FA3|nr:uncharacterized protein N7510_007548 [Penicillium lagena]KAJ5610829.1 hypothetical protein N7510_007548 [Penicillium lagena]
MPTVSKTCQSCANSKVRCIRSPDNPHTCNRCFRLGRECIRRETGRRFNGFHKDRKIEALESRIKELLTDRAATSEEPSDAPTNSVSNVENKPTFESANDLHDVVDRGFLSMVAAERYLEIFRTTMTPQFPFVVVSPQVSVLQLREDRPFLFLAILASASYEDMPLQRLLGAEVKKVIACRMVLNGDVSFDLLQGLLVFLAWSHYHAKPRCYTQFLQLAISLIIDLRLDRPPESKTWKTKLLFAPQFNLNDAKYSRESWHNDEKRALIGCYYLSSSISIHVLKQSNFPCTSYIEKCCQSLYDTPEHTYDKYLIYIVQLQRIAEKIDRLSASHGQELMRPGSGTELYVINMKSDLESFQSQLPFNIDDTPLLAIHFHTTGLSLYQLAFTIAGQQPKHKFTTSRSWRDEMSYAALHAAESTIHLYLSLPADLELGFVNTQWVQMAFAMLAAYRLTVIVSRPEQTAAFVDTLAQLRQRVGALSTPHVDFNGGRDVFFGFRNRITYILNRLDGSDSKADAMTSSVGIDEVDDFSHAPEYGSTDLASWPQVGSLMPMIEDAEFPHDSLFDASIEQMMRNWI